jgi:hypothetical protein
MSSENGVAVVVFAASVFAFLFSRKALLVKKSIFLPPYKRLQFTTPPVFGDEFIVGNLNEIVRDIEKHIFEYEQWYKYERKLSFPLCHQSSSTWEVIIT